MHSRGIAQKVFDDMDERARLNVQEMRLEKERQALRDQFMKLDHAEVAKKSDQELATWQSQFPPDSPHAIFAGHEWQRRLTVAQVGAMKFAAYVGVAGSLLGIVIGAFLGASLQKPVSDSEVKSANSSTQTESRSTVQAPMAPAASSPKSITVSSPQKQ
ncbi:MAG: hypothetical protein V4858_08890 [Pseudomonadota bacterium]